ncbi:hypothetical protein KIN20_006349 [Parelaphostrongylus tenuis]|uniref:Uncharacterized protein n=1 Tax=Parelaphostrongylus tenuis TaxID=148309 RepID=A0AAD5QI88_PARTN|nr:hypothetical protein KIN20_006349 [Parelaphostrongylus tenuis]
MMDLMKLVLDQGKHLYADKFHITVPLAKTAAEKYVADRNLQEDSGRYAIGVHAKDTEAVYASNLGDDSPSTTTSDAVEKIVEQMVMNILYTTIACVTVLLHEIWCDLVCQRFKHIVVKTQRTGVIGAAERESGARHAPSSGIAIIGRRISRYALKVVSRSPEHQSGLLSNIRQKKQLQTGYGTATPDANVAISINLTGVTYTRRM